MARELTYWARELTYWARENPLAVTLAVAGVGGICLKLYAREPKHEPPDYSDGTLWFRKDSGGHKDFDCFFLHPTTVVGAFHWNCCRRGYGPKDNAVIPDIFAAPDLLENDAGAFAEMCNMWVPRYSQMGFITQLNFKPKMNEAELKKCTRAINVAYNDARASFEHFLQTRPDKKRPFIIAAHSQGSLLMTRVISECVCGSEHTDAFVAAYLAGGYVPFDLFETVLKGVHPCRGPRDTNCIISWDTRIKGKFDPASMQKWPMAMYPSIMHWLLNGKYCGECPSGPDDSKNRLQINPMTWTREAGGEFLGAKVHGSDEPAMPSGRGEWDSTKVETTGSYLMIPEVTKKWWPQLPGPAEAVGNLHPGDVQFFFFNIRANVKERLLAA